MKKRKTAIRPRVPVIMSILFVSMAFYGWSKNSLSTGARYRGFTYGSLWMEYKVEERRFLGDKVGYLIAIPGFQDITSRCGNGDDYYVYYRDGEKHSFLPDPEGMTWVNRGTGPKTIPANLTMELIRKIDTSREDAKGNTFSSGGGLLEWLETLKPVAK